MLSLVVILPMQTMACFIFDMHFNVCLMVMTSTNPDVRNTATASRCFNRQCLFGFTLSSFCKFWNVVKIGNSQIRKILVIWVCLWGTRVLYPKLGAFFPDSNGTLGAAKHEA